MFSRQVIEITFLVFLGFGAIFFLSKTAEVLFRILRNGERMDRQLLPCTPTPSTRSTVSA